MVGWLVGLLDSWQAASVVALMVAAVVVNCLQKLTGGTRANMNFSHKYHNVHVNEGACFVVGHNAVA